VNKSKHIQVVLPENLVEDIAYLKESMGLATTSSVLRRAIKIARKLMKEAETGWQIIIKHRDGTETKLVIL